MLPAQSTPTEAMATNVTNGVRTNGTNGTNGSYPVTNTSSSTSRHPDKGVAASGSSAPLAAAEKPVQPKANREGVTAAFTQFGQLIHSPRRPLPTKNGSGTASVKRTQTGLRVDLRYIGWKGTLSFFSRWCLEVY